MMQKKLIKLLTKSYSPYSNFQVAAIVVAQSGAEYYGVNVENAAFPATICAERVALGSAITAGEKPRDLKTIYVLSGSQTQIITPCGVCRQTMAELMNAAASVICYDLQGKIRQNSLDELLPFSFQGQELDATKL